MRIFIVMALVFVSLSSGACRTGGDFRLDTTSPGGLYRVRLQGSVDPPNARPGENYVQRVRIDALKRNETFLVDDEFYREDNYEPQFLQAYPLQEWINDSTLRLGRKSSGDPFQDQIVVSNETQDPIEFLRIQYGKYEMFLAFDLAPGDELRLAASPQFFANPSASIVSYAAYINGERLDGVVEGSQRNSPTAGSQQILVKVKKS